ncbi:MAG: hypothetical protein HN823_09755 [Gammaproteobacteria bacterium]|nr:hypothetical protein [Gammaproteobacteria bacterium]
MSSIQVLDEAIIVGLTAQTIAIQTIAIQTIPIQTIAMIEATISNG